MFAPTGRREVAEEVVKAALTTLVTGLIAWGIDELKERAKRRREEEARARDGER